MKPTEVPFIATTVQEAEKMVDEANTIESLKAHEPMLSQMRMQRLNQLTTEPDKSKREALQDELFEIKQIQGHLASKCMAIARTKIKKPRFM